VTHDATPTPAQGPVALGPYRFAPRDTVLRFPQPLLYVGWDEHMMFCAPLAIPLPDMRFDEFIARVLPRLYGQHPDFARIDWTRVQWFRSAALFTPELRATLAAQGFHHKSVLRFRTPGLEGLKGSCG
jgi:phenol/toluene 2-monooxygenase (NADH) P4/A4